MATHRFGTRRVAYPWRAHPVVRQRRPGSTAFLVDVAVATTADWHSYRGFQHRLQPDGQSPVALHHCTCGGPPRARHPCGRFTPFDSCRPPIRSRRRSRRPSAPGPTQARMTLFRSSVPPSLHGVRTGCHSAARRGCLAANEVRSVALRPAHTGQPKRARSATAACHSWSEPFGQSHHIRRDEPTVTSVGRTEPFRKGCHWAAVAGTLTARLVSKATRR